MKRLLWVIALYAMSVAAAQLPTGTIAGQVLLKESVNISATDTFEFRATVARP